MEKTELRGRMVYEKVASRAYLRRLAAALRSIAENIKAGETDRAVSRLLAEARELEVDANAE